MVIVPEASALAIEALSSENIFAFVPERERLMSPSRLTPEILTVAVDVLYAMPSIVSELALVLNVGPAGLIDSVE